MRLEPQTYKTESQNTLSFTTLNWPNLMQQVKNFSKELLLAYKHTDVRLGLFHILCCFTVYPIDMPIKIAITMFGGTLPLTQKQQPQKP